MTAPGWPVELASGRVGLRPVHRTDAPAWVRVRDRNRRWLLPWEATAPDSRLAPQTPAVYRSMIRGLRSQARLGLALPWVITYDGDFAGQLTISNIVRGSLNSGHAGYWVDERVAGRGVMPTALALAVDHSFGPVGLHRIEANIRPENSASRRVVEKLGFRDEGLHERYLHINGAYRDHLCFAVTVEEARGGVLKRLRAGH